MRLSPALALLPLTACLHACAAERPDEFEARQLSEYPGSMLEDRHGDLWFATAFDGVIRYDGTEFVTFTTADGLASNTVRELLEDQDGVLWFATAGGLTRYDGTTFELVADYAEQSSPQTFAEHGDHRDLWDVHIDRQGRLWIASLDGVFVRDGTSFARFPLAALAGAHAYEFTPSMVYCIFEDRDGALWFGTDGAGVVRYDGESQVAFSTADGLCSDHVCAILRDPRGDYWFGTSNGGVSHYDGTSFTTHLRNPTFSEHNGWGRFLGMLADRDGQVWFGRASPGGGAYRFDGADFELLSEAHGLGTGGVIAISADRSGQIWLGTTSGVYRFDGTRFANFTLDD